MAHYAPSFPFGHFITNRRHFSLSLPLSFYSPDPFLALSFSSPDGRAVANKTVDEVARPISGKADDTLSFSSANKCFFFQSLFVLSPFLSLYSSRSCAVLRQTRCVEFYCAHDCSRLNKTDRKTRSECVPHFRQSSRIFLISSRSLNIIFRDVFVPFLHSVFSFFFPPSL